MVQPRRIPWTDTIDPAREEHVDLAWRDPAEAKRERLRARVEYWRRRLQALRERTELLRALLGQPELEDGTTPVDRWNGRVELDLALTDLMQATDRLFEAEREARAAGTKIEPFGWHPAPAPAILPPAGPKKRGPKLKCECGTCARCRAREAMRRRRAEQKAKKAARKARRAAAQ